MRSAVKSLLCVAAVLLASPAWAGDVFVIASSNVDVDSADVRDLFVGEKQMSRGVRITPIDNAAVKAEFVEKVIQTSASRYDDAWLKRNFRDGVNPPVQKGSDAEVIALIRATPGRIGYVSKLPPDVKLIAKF